MFLKTTLLKLVKNCLASSLGESRFSANDLRPGRDLRSRVINT